MARFFSLRNISTFVIIIALFASLALICDEEESFFDIAYDAASAISVSSYRGLFDNPLYYSSLFYSDEHPASSKQFILYVARQEKSPPILFS